jgi:large subunit ribosomal protein L4
MEKTETKKKSVKAPAPKKAATKAEGVSLSAKVYSQAGKETSEIKLPESIFGLSWNADLVHQVVYSMLSNARTIYAHTKGRGDVRGGGRKPWRQKGTGRARHGSTRSPIWVGGGVAHGPNALKNYSRKINRKMKAKALFTILSKKFKDGEIVFVDSVKFAKPKTADAVDMLAAFSKIKNYSDILSKKNNSALIATSGKEPMVEKSFANLGNISVEELRNVNPVELLNTKYVLIENPSASIKFMEHKMK